MARALVAAFLFAAAVASTLSPDDVDPQLVAEIAGARARAATPRMILSPTSALPAPMQMYLDTLHAAMRVSTPVGTGSAATPQDCMAYALAYEFALRTLPARAPLLDVWAALRLGPDCGAAPPPDTAALGLPPVWPPASRLPDATVEGADSPTFYVAATGGDDANDGSLTRPFATVLRGVDATRAARPPGAGPASVVLRGGVHLLGATVQLDGRDAGLALRNFGGEAAWVSGGAPVGPLAWTAVNVSGAGNASVNVYTAALPAAAAPSYLTALQTVAADGSPGKRLFRAQYPNFNPEWHATAACGGGTRAAAAPECVALAASSPLLRAVGARIAEHSPGGAPFEAAGGARGVRDPAVIAWLKPANFTRPAVFFRDLAALGLKNDSAMDNYNRYAAGRGGACGLWTNAWPAEHSYGWDYHCGNVSDGGWEEVDELMQSIGQLNLPVGLALNASVLPNVARWRLNVDPEHRTNAASVVNVWMTQGWFNNYFYVTGQQAVNASGAGVLNLTADDGRYPAGGWQGGRHWQTQCSFDGCGPGGPLLAGGWSVSNVAAELDAYDEFFYDPAAGTLTVFYNASSTEAGQPQAPPPPGLVMLAPQLEVFFNLSAGAADVTIDGLGFRDQRLTVLEEPWVVPSGGDWGLRPAGAVSLVDTVRCTVSNARFLRTDGNALFLGGRNRNASVLDSEFAWLGMSAVASLGWTEQDDGTGGAQPWGTLLSGLLCHEIGLHEKQSSCYFSGRTPLARVEASLFFNGPRAMLNLNDHLGGGGNYTGALMFNSCRESGDHGAMNSWDRQPFRTRIASGGGAASYAPARTETSRSFIIANYGSSQGFDNDDGSNYMWTHDNFFYQADGLKMDYGGHDSIFSNNVVIVRPYDGQNCQNMWPFLPGHQHSLHNNTCAIWPNMAPGAAHDADMVLAQNDCGACDSDRSATPHFSDNRYYTTHGNASANCGPGGWGTTLAAIQETYDAGFEARSTWGRIADVTPDAVVQWGRDVLGL